VGAGQVRSLWEKGEEKLGLMEPLGGGGEGEETLGLGELWGGHAVRDGGMCTACICPMGSSCCDH
jgi:hypothetical protein